MIGLITKANTYSDCVELTYASVDFLGKEYVYKYEKVKRLDQNNIEGFEFKASTFSIYYQNEVNTVDIIDIKR